MSENTVTQTLQADLVVVGAGGAGLPAALTAQAAGLKNVIVAEKRAVVGGNAGMSGGFLFAMNSEPQRENGVSGSPDEIFRDTMAYYHYDGVDPRLIRMWIDEADNNVSWLESLGVGYRPWGGPGLVVEPSGWSNHPGSFKRAMDIMADKVVADGGQVLTKTAITGIVADEQGVKRVLATGPNGPIEIETTRVLLATGGFTGNVDLLEGEFPGVYDESIYWTDTKRLAGDGIKLAEQAGGDVTGRTFLIKESCYSFKTKKNKPNRASMEASSLWVNKYGERFLDESIGGATAGANALVAQPGMSGYALFDDTLVQQVIDRPDPFAGEIRPGEDDPGAWTSGGYRQSLRDELADPANHEWCIAADSWDEIAAWIGASPDVLKATVEEYNRYCEQGHDELWGKPAEFLQPLAKGPFYVLKFRPLMIDTAGPVRVDRNLRVVDENNEPVRGLYAAGAVASGWIGADEYKFGTPLSWAIGSGRIAGEHAAADI